MNEIIMTEEDYEYDNFEEKPTEENLKRTLSLLMNKSKISEIIRALNVRIPDVSLSIAFHTSYFERMKIFFLVNGKNLDRREIRRFADELETKFLGHKNGISVQDTERFDARDIQERFKSVLPFSEKSGEYEAVVDALKEHYKEYLESNKSPLTKSREQHGVFTKSPEIGSPPRTGKETTQPSPEGPSPRVEVTAREETTTTTKFKIELEVSGIVGQAEIETVLKSSLAAMQQKSSLVPGKK